MLIVIVVHELVQGCALLETTIYRASVFVGVIRFKLSGLETLFQFLLLRLLLPLFADTVDHNE